MFVLTFVQQIILIAVGQFLFGVDYLRDPAALLLMMIALSLVASTLGLLLAALLKSEQALIATTVLTSMAVAALSGAWFPLEITGPAFRSSATCCRRRGSSTGCAGIILRGFGVPDVLPAFGVALAWGGRPVPDRRLALPPERLIDRARRPPRAGAGLQSFAGLMLASLGSARLAATSIALMMPDGTGQAGWTRCSAARRSVSGPSPR